jgi:hypothetical protein
MVFILGTVRDLIYLSFVVLYHLPILTDDFILICKRPLCRTEENARP